MQMCVFCELVMQQHFMDVWICLHDSGSQFFHWVWYLRVLINLVHFLSPGLMLFLIFLKALQNSRFRSRILLFHWEVWLYGIDCGRIKFSGWQKGPASLFVVALLKFCCSESSWLEMKPKFCKQLFLFFLFWFYISCSFLLLLLLLLWQKCLKRVWGVKRS